MKRARKNKVVSIVFSLLPALILVSFAAVIAAGLYDCPTRILFNIPCPGCNMTEAYFKLVQLDFKAAFALHPLFPIPAFFFVYSLFRQRHALPRQVENAIVILSVLLFIIRWIIILHL